MFKEVATLTSALKPKPRSGATLVHVEDRIFIVGGQDSSGNLQKTGDLQVMLSISAYLTERNEWKIIPARLELAVRVA